MEDQLIEYLSQFVTVQRFELIKKVAALRTRYMTVLIENVYQSHNASAVIRTCEGLGVQDIHIVENDNIYEINPDVVMGANKWMDVKMHNSSKQNTLNTIQHLKNQGYRIIATTPHTNDVNIENFDVTKGKFALMFGTEVYGLSKEAIENADEFLKIPMLGFTESFNISVCAGMILHFLNHKIRSSGAAWQLSDDEIKLLHLQWLRSSIKRVDLIEKHYLEKVLA
jgi:tRNA (guanosine-2'-O-)-methyltransferase